MITIIITIMKNNKDSKSNNNNDNNNDNNKSFSNDSNRSYDWSYVLLTQAFLKLDFYNYE